MVTIVSFYIFFYTHESRMCFYQAYPTSQPSQLCSYSVVQIPRLYSYHTMYALPDGLSYAQDGSSWLGFDTHPSYPPNTIQIKSSIWTKLLRSMRTVESTWRYTASCYCCRNVYRILQNITGYCKDIAVITPLSSHAQKHECTLQAKVEMY